MHKRTLGRTGPAVSTLGLGAMGMSGAYGESDRSESVATVHAALEAGVTLIDTGDFYAMGHNELLLAEALRGRKRDSYELSVKFGMLSGPVPAFAGADCRPEAVKNFLAYSLNRLGTDYIDIYRPARLDPAVPIEETVAASTSERPTCRTYPARISSAMAPTVSSIGTAGSSRAGR